MEKYEYGAMSSKYELKAENKLIAYASMVFHYGNSAHFIAIYEPIECKDDSWLNPMGKISERLDEIFGGIGSFDDFVSNNVNEIKKSMSTIKKII